MKASKIISGGIVLACLTGAAHAAETRVVTERISTEEATPGFEFRNVPAPSRKDAAEQGEFSVIAGERDPNGGNVAVLKDGKLPVGEDQPSANLFFQARTSGGRVLLDLKKGVEVGQVNSYSWHPAGRGPQVYKLYARAEAGSNLEQSARAEDPAEEGWKLLGAVDTRGDAERPGGQYGASVSSAEGSLGEFRYLLFDISNTSPEDPFSNTFYSEIDVVEAGTIPEAIGYDAPEGRFTITTGGDKYQITVDASRTPELVGWVEEDLIPVVREWYPKLVEMLPSEGYEAPERLSITFDPEMDGVAHARGTRIECSGDWFKRNRDGEGKGAVVHELVHVVQQYGRGRRNNPDATRTPGWIVEGIPDYIRWFLYEPETKGAEITARNIDRAKYDANYRITGNFLNWVVQQHGEEIIRELNAAAREGRYDAEIWKKHTGKTVEELGEEWREAVTAKLRAG